MNQIINYFWIFLISVVRLQFTSATTIDDSIKTINGKRTLTASYCNNEGNSVTYIGAYVKSIDVIQQDTFWNCKNVTTIDLGENQIKELHQDTFKLNTKLERLYLHCNQISFIPNELFKPLANLIWLSLSGNLLGTIQPVLESGLNELKYFYVAGIELSELDPEELASKLPKLKELDWFGNFIECSVYDSIQTRLATKSIQNYERKYSCNSKDKKCLPESKIEKKIKEINVKIETQKEYMTKELDGVKESIDNFTKLFLETSRNFSLQNLQQEQLNSQILDVVQQASDNFTDIKNQQVEFKSTLGDKLNEWNETILVQISDFKQSLDEKEERIKSQILDTIQEVTDNFTEIINQLVEVDSTLHNKINENSEAIQSQNQAQVQFKTELDIEITDIKKELSDIKNSFQDLSETANLNSQTITNNFSSISNQISNLEETYANLSIPNDNNRSQVFQLDNSRIMGFKNNHDSMLKNVSEALIIIQNLTEKRVTMFWLAVTFIIVWLTLITGFVLIKSSRENSTDAINSTTENSLEMESHS